MREGGLMINQEAIDFVKLISQNNVEVIPLSGKDGKKPRVSRFKNRTIHHRETIRLLEAGEISTYGIRLRGLTVIDIDEKNTVCIEEVESIIGKSNFIVETGRGYHLYYNGENRFIKPFTFDVDVKSGWNSYVVGPYSMRPDGVYYEPIKGNFIDPPLTDCNVPASLFVKRSVSVRGSSQVIPSNKIPVGHRHKYLLSQAWKLAEECRNDHELTDKLLLLASRRCAEPESISFWEVRNIAIWILDKELIGERYTKEFSEVKISRVVIDRLIAFPGGSDALALYVLLASKHRHLGNNFAIDFHGMKNGQLTDLGRDRFKRARAFLLELGLIQRAENYKVGSRPYTYRFP